MCPVDVIGLEVGYRLIPLVDKSQGGQLLARIRALRKNRVSGAGVLDAFCAHSGTIWI